MVERLCVARPLIGCQGPVGSAQWRTVELPVRGQQNCPVVARCSARGSVGQWRYPLAGGGLGEADAVAGGHDDVGVVELGRLGSARSRCRGLRRLGVRSTVALAMVLGMSSSNPAG